MLKTDQGRKTRITEKVGKPVGQETVVVRKHPQYLEVAIEKSRKESELKTERKVKETDKDNVKQRKVNYIPYERVGSKQTSEASTVGARSQGYSNKRQEAEKTAKSGKGGNQHKKHRNTFNDEKWFENKENQLLYEELDRMLEGANSMQKLGNKKPAEKKVEKSDKPNKTEQSDKPIKVVYSNKKPKPRPLEPDVVLEYKRLPPDRTTRLNKHGFFGPEGTKVWKECEERTKEALDKIDNIDNFQLGDFTSRTKKLEAKRRAEFAEYAERVVPDVPQQVTATVTNQNHIIADIPIYLPAGFDENIATIETVRGPILHSVLPTGQIQSSVDIGDHLSGLPVPLSTDPLNTYRNHANPVRERILLEQAERERIQLEKETLGFFDADQGEEPDVVPALGPKSETLRQAKKDKTNRSAPPPYENSRDKLGRQIPKGHVHEKSHSAERRKTPELNDLTHRSRNTYPDANVPAKTQRENSYGKLKYSPEAFQAHLDRKARLEKEARILSKAETTKSKWDIEDEALAKQRYRRAQIDSRLDKELPENMDTYRIKRKETHRDNDDVDMTLKILDEKQREFLYEQYGGPETFRVPKEKLNVELNQSERGRYVDQDRYSDRNINSYREKDTEQQKKNDFADQTNNKTEELYSYRSLKGDTEQSKQNRKTYSDRNINSYREKDTEQQKKNDLADRTNHKTEEAYSYRSLKEHTEQGRQSRKIAKTNRQDSEKVEYILRSKSSDSKQSSHSNRNVNKDMKREDTYEAGIKVRMDREISSGTRTHRSKKSGRKNSQQFEDKLRQPPADKETRQAVAAKIVAGARKEVTEAQREHEDPELSKYFMGPERADSKSNNIPLYSKSQYSRQDGELEDLQEKNKGQESSYRIQTERDKEMVHVTLRPETVDTGVNTEPNSGDKQASTDNLIPPKKEQGSKEEKNASAVQNKAESARETEITSSRSVPNNAAKLAREKTREKTRDKLTRQKTKEKTMDSQGPTSEEKLNIEDLETAGILNLDDIEEGLDDNEIYVCYLVTDDGAAIGPMRLDIEDIQIGLPKGGDHQAERENNIDNQENEKGEDENEGMRNRQTGSHGLNEFSSRSHSMLMLTIDSEMQDPDDENLYITKRGKLTFVDLAGSEKVKDSNSTAETLVESNNINRSLLILGNCISSLGDPKRRQGHIPYRDSKLTKLLADSLGGNGVTLMICCITPSSHHASETMNTLRYASRAKKIRTKPVIKMDPREKLILSLKKEIKVLRNENHYLRQQLEFPAKPKGQLQKENDEQFMKMMKETNGKPPPPNNTLPPQEKLMQNGAKDESGLYEMLQEYMVENESLRTDNSEMQAARDRQRQEQQLLYRDNEKLMKRVDELERKVNNAQNSWQAMPRQGSDNARSRGHSPTRGSPQYVMGGPGNGGRQPPNRLPPPPDLPLRDPVYPGSPHQGYNSPTGSGNKGKQPNRGQPMKPPHRLNDPLQQQRPVQEQNGPYMNGHPPPAQFRQNAASPNRATDMRMDSRRSSQSTSSDAIRDMNEKLKQELAQLEGQIHQHTALNNRNRSIYGSQGSLR